MNLKQLAARLRADTKLMAVIHITDEEALAIARALERQDKRDQMAIASHPHNCLCRNCS